MNTYFGTYANFDTLSKKDAADLLGADTVVGDVLTVECTLEAEAHRAWLVNRFGKRVGFFDAKLSRKLSLLAAGDMELRAILSFVAFTDHPDDGHYWGNAAIIGFNPAYKNEFDIFISNVADKIGDGLRPQIDFKNDAAEKIVESGGAWLPKKNDPVPEKSKGTAIIKNRRKLSDKLIDKGRAGNKGCYFVSWAFLLAVVALVVFALKSCIS